MLHHLASPTIEERLPLFASPCALCGPQVLPGSGPPDDALLDGPAVVWRAGEVLLSPSVGFGLSGEQPGLTAPSITTTTRLEFLQRALSRRFSQRAVGSITHPLCGNTSLAGDSSRNTSRGMRREPHPPIWCWTFWPG
ncbi:hypothetical protein E2C01_084618 [Portunus trituberculatus]|uniref:Uncharacterized protein n=1 Tax=Portunus trituberculatus TaxID=210409 RepID=A0A5B7JB73_PORTR|nr:hypothetical protein [Portunus trituberculatus]